jgi:hypothetical protein
MKQNNKMKPFDNLLMAYITKENQDTFVSSSSDKESEIVFTKQFNDELTKEKTSVLLSSLVQSLSKDTLGSLVEKALSQITNPANEIQSLTGLSPSLLEEIKTDMVFTNSVPVKSLVKLLKFLNISLDKAMAAINITFDKLSTENKIFLSIPANIQPAFRKGVSHIDSAFDFKKVKSDESYLYQNKEALEKYTKRFAELYDEL